jgi:hypothetical protein
MGILDRFRKKKKGVKPAEEVKKPTELEMLCGDDKETYEALSTTMFLDPRKIKTSMKEAEENAKKFKKSGDLVGMRTQYEIAGGLAIYQGNVKKVVKFFSECQKISPNTSYPILKNPEKAIAKAREYYEKYLKEEKR